MNPARRPLQFASLDAIMPDVDRLLQGHSTVGAWSLGQICDHLATVARGVIRLPAEDPTVPPDPAQAARKRWFFTTGQFHEGNDGNEGMAMPPGLAPPAPLTPAEGAARLRAAMAQYQKSAGPVGAHPSLGPLTKDEWDRWVRTHAAHHLSFAVPAVEMSPP